MKRQISIQSFFANSPKRKKNDDDEDARPTNTKESDEIDKQSCTSNPRLPENQSPNELTTWLCRTLKDDEKYTLYTNGLTIPDHFKFPYTKIGDRNRCFQRDWMNKYPGLVYSIAEDGAYCLHCALFEYDVVQFFNWSPKRQSILEEKLDMVQNDNKRMKLKELCRTRWVERHDAFETFWDFLPAIIDAMEKIKSIDKSPAAVSDTQSLENNITSFQFLVSLLVTMRCIGYLKQLSVSLQGRAVDVVTALRSVNLVKEALQDVRTNIDSFHGKWYNEVKNLAEELDITPAKPRTCGRQTKRSNVPSETTEDYFKKTIAIPLLDHILTEMNSRFGDLQVKASMGLQVLPSMMANSGNFDLDYFMDDLPSPSTLEQELHMWKLKWAQDNDPPSDIQSAIENCNKTLFPNIHKILTICGVFPVTSCECERSISKLRLVKTYLRSTMSTSRASSLILLYIHRNITIEATEVVKKYAMSNPRRMTFPDILSE